MRDAHALPDRRQLMHSLGRQGTRANRGNSHSDHSEGTA